MTLTDPPAHPDPHQGKVIRVYALFGLGLVLSLVPNLFAAGASAILIMAVLMMAYIFRTDTEQGSLLENHMTFIIRTIWIGSFVALIGMALGSAYLFKALNHNPMMPCMQDFLNLGPAAAAYGPDYLMNIFTKCWPEYWQVNLMALLIGGSMAAGPVLIYFVARYIRGITRATRGYRIAHPKAWF